MNTTIINNVTVKELRELCKNHGVPVSGNKADLQRRLYKFAEDVNHDWFVLFTTTNKYYHVFTEESEAIEFYNSIVSDDFYKEVAIWTPADFIADGNNEKYKEHLNGYLCDNDLGNEEEIADEYHLWMNLVNEMNMKDGKPHVYEHTVDRPVLQQIMLHVCRDLYLDTLRAVKVANGDKTAKQFGPTFVSKKHKCICMKDAMAKGAVKVAAEKVLSKEQQQKFIVFNPTTKHTEFKQAVQVLEKLDYAGLINGHDTDKDYAKFYTVYPEEILQFLQTVGCLKK